MVILFMQAPENPKKARTAYDSTDDYGVKSDKIDPEVDENYDDTFGEDFHSGEDVGGYGYDQDYDLDDYWINLPSPLRNRGHKMCIRNCWGG